MFMYVDVQGLFIVFDITYRRGDIAKGTLSSKQATILLDECLHLLIIVLGERYVEGVGEVDSSAIIQREIVHQLSVTKMSHSDLNKSLPEDVSQYVATTSFTTSLTTSYTTLYAMSYAMS